MRRGLKPSDLGNLFEQPLAVVLSIGLPDGSVFSRRGGSRSLLVLRKMGNELRAQLLQLLL
jgi:hypothetical protein